MSPVVRNLVIPLLAAIVLFFFWNSFFVYPFRIFVVFLHELSHGIAAVLTGGSIVKIELSPQEGGLCITSGGIGFFVYSAGYLGSLLWGALLLILSSRGRLDRILIGVLAVLTIAITVLYVRTWFGFGYGLAAGGLMLLVAAKMRESVSAVLVKVIGVTSCLYAIWDIGSDVLFRSIHNSDASQLAKITFIPAIVWGVLWIGISLVVLALTFRIVLAQSKKAQRVVAPV